MRFLTNQEKFICENCNFVFFCNLALSGTLSRYLAFWFSEDRIAGSLVWLAQNFEKKNYFWISEHLTTSGYFVLDFLTTKLGAERSFILVLLIFNCSPADFKQSFVVVCVFWFSCPKLLLDHCLSDLIFLRVKRNELVYTESNQLPLFDPE